MRRSALIIGLVVAQLAVALSGSASTIATTDATAISAFQNGATIVTFEGISGITAFNNQTPGTDVPATALLKNQVAGLTFSSNAIEGPAVLDLTGFGNAGDAESTPNVVSGTEIGLSGNAAICFNCFVEVTFASPVSRVGAFNDPTGGVVRLFATDQGGATIFEQVDGDQGEFIGADTGINNIERALFLFISAQAVTGFTLDNVTYARAGTTTVPEPATLSLLGGGLVALAWIRKRTTRRSAPVR